MLNYVIVANKPGTIVEIHRNQKISVQKLLGNFKLSHACCQSISNTRLEFTVITHFSQKETRNLDVAQWNVIVTQNACYITVKK